MMNSYYYPPGAYPAGWESGYPQFARTYLIDRHSDSSTISRTIMYSSTLIGHLEPKMS